MVYLRLVGKRMVDFLLVLIKPFCQLSRSRLRRYERILVVIVVFEMAVSHFDRKFRGKWGSPTNDYWRQKARVPVLSRGIVCVILRLAVLVQYRRVTDG